MTKTQNTQTNARCTFCDFECYGPDIQQLLERHICKDHPGMSEAGFSAGGHV